MHQLGTAIAGGSELFLLLDPATPLGYDDKKIAPGAIGAIFYFFKHVAPIAAVFYFFYFLFAVCAANDFYEHRAVPPLAGRA